MIFQRRVPWVFMCNVNPMVSAQLTLTWLCGDMASREEIIPLNLSFPREVEMTEPITKGYCQVTRGQH